MKIVNDAISIVFDNALLHLAQQGILGNVSFSDINGNPNINVIGNIVNSGSINVNSEQSTKMLKEIYQNRFEKYNPFFFDLGFQFDMNSWIPIKLVAEQDDGDEQKDHFKLIADRLKNGLVVITGLFVVTMIELRFQNHL